jgi:hypothetical protein
MVRYPTLLLGVFLATFALSPASASASGAAIAVPVELRGSPASMKRQNAVAVQAGLPFARSFEDIERMIAEGHLVRLLGDDHYELRDGLSSDAARPEMRLFVGRLAEEYFGATGEKLVVTSLTRPASSQPSNAHALSVHPTGLALDLRISQVAASRQWIERRLLEMEKEGLLDVTREKHPPHYHIALFPEAYLAHLEGLIGAEALAAALSGEQEVEDEAPSEAQVEVELSPVEEEAAPPARRWRWSFVAGLFNRLR